MLQQCLPFTVLKLQMAPLVMLFITSCNSAYRLRYWNAINIVKWITLSDIQLQQCLPFTVLKQSKRILAVFKFCFVATVLTVYGIETFSFCIIIITNFIFVATVLTVYGIETLGVDG